MVLLSSARGSIAEATIYANLIRLVLISEPPTPHRCILGWIESMRDSRAPERIALLSA